MTRWNFQSLKKKAERFYDKQMDEGYCRSRRLHINAHYMFLLGFPNILSFYSCSSGVRMCYADEALIIFLGILFYYLILSVWCCLFLYGYV